jgi:hypothetical protein
MLAYQRQKNAAEALQRTARAQVRAVDRKAAAVELQDACRAAAGIASGYAGIAVSLSEALNTLLKAMGVCESAEISSIVGVVQQRAETARHATAAAEEAGGIALTAAAAASTLAVAEAFSVNASAAAARARLIASDAALVAVQTVGVGAARAVGEAISVAAAEVRGDVLPCPLDDALFDAERSARLVIFLDAACLRELHAHRTEPAVLVRAKELD